MHASFHADSSVMMEGPNTMNDNGQNMCQYGNLNEGTFTKSGNDSVIALGDIKSFPLQQKRGVRAAATSCVRSFKGILIHLIFCMHLFFHFIIEEMA